MTDNIITSAGTTTRAVIYTRFSPRPDAATSESCEIQRSYCEIYAHEHGYQVSAIFDDPDVSGSDEFREKLWHAIAAIKKGDVLLVYKRDRLARNVYLSEAINRAVDKKGGRIEAVTGDVAGDGPEQQLIRQVCAAMAEYERKSISRRTSDCLRAKQRAGQIVSARLPYGFKRDPNDSSRMIPDEHEQKLCAEIMRRYDEGQTINHIATTLPPEWSRQGHWHSSIVRAIVNRLLRDRQGAASS